MPIFLTLDQVVASLPHSGGDRCKTAGPLSKGYVLMSVTNGGGKRWEGCKGFHPVDELPSEVQWGAFFFKGHQG